LFTDLAITLDAERSGTLSLWDGPDSASVSLPESGSALGFGGFVADSSSYPTEYFFVPAERAWHPLCS